MATAAPDPRTFESWEDAFQYPIPTVRALEKKLRTHINENNDKLRSLVGSSYRDLLGTANTIVGINEEMQHVESTISSIARRSDSRILDKISRNNTRLIDFRKEQERPQASLSSQMAVLHRTLDIVSRLLRSKGSTLLAAKLLVISRLLHKNSSQGHDMTGFLEDLGNKLASLRLRLLKHIDKNLSVLQTSENKLVEDLTAFSLATSSSPTDVLVHFHHLRSDTIRKTESRASPDSGRASIRRLELYVGTCRETRATFPDVLRASLRSLSAAPLFRDPAVRAFDELRLDIHEQWISDEVRNYTPFTRHDELQKTKTTQMLQEWTSKSLDTLIHSIKTDLESITDLEVLLKARKETLQTWLSSRQHVRGFSHHAVLNQLRDPFQNRALSIVRDNLQGLQRSVQDPVNGLLISWQNGVILEPTESLWSPTVLSIDSGGGAVAFKKAIIHRRNGRGEDKTFDVLDDFEQAAKTLEGVAMHIKRMQDARWDDDYEMDDDDDNDADNKASVAQLLSKDDPAALQKEFRSSINTSVKSMETWLTSNVTDEHALCDAPNSSGVILIRILRELRYRIPQLRLSLDPDTPQTLFGQDLVSKIQTRLVASVQQNVDEQLASNLEHLMTRRMQIHTLWDGTPPLPVLPSPATFKHLRAVVKRMELLGTDLWSPDVVAALKLSLAKSAVQHLQPHVDNLKEKLNEASAPASSAPSVETDNKPEKTTNGTKEEQETNETNETKSDDAEKATENGEANGTEPQSIKAEIPPDQSPEKLIQLLFDTHYLQQALSPTSTSSSTASNREGANGVEETLSSTVTALETTGGLDEADAARVRKAAADYWRRSYLLFGLLSY